MLASIWCVKPDNALVAESAVSAGWVVLDAGAAFAGHGSEPRQLKLIVVVFWMQAAGKSASRRSLLRRITQYRKMFG